MFKNNNHLLITMDFLEFLKKSSSNNEEPQPIKNIKKQDNKIKDIKTKDKKHIDIEKLKHKNQPNENINTISTYKTINRGDFIKIIYQKNSPLNCYKGYIGEIKDYRKDQDYALIFLHAINSSQFIKVPLTHFIPYNYSYK